jgi:hypothetical protein
MIWLFVLGVLGFAIFHPGFRKVCFWIGGLSIAGIAITALILNTQESQRRLKLAAQASAYDQCDSKPFDALKFAQCMADKETLKSF